MNRCPKCGKRVELKNGKYGLFYGCSNFPKCNFTADYESCEGNEFDNNRYEEYEWQKDLDGFLVEIMNG